MQVKPKGLFWLASYPKSGNTWTRTFLAHLLALNTDDNTINSLTTGAIASSREWVEAGLGIDISELSHDEIDTIRPLAYGTLAHDATALPEDVQVGFHKIHDAYSYLADGNALISPAATRGAVYLVRNPLDIVFSYANHASISIDKSIKALCNPEHAFSKTTRSFESQLRQKLFTWSEHVESWLNADINKLIVRYEDIKQNPYQSFFQITRFFELGHCKEDILQAIEKSQFERLQSQEIKYGFKEKAPRVKKFFRKGIVGDWQDKLTSDQIDTLIAANYPSMKKLGYLDHNDHPLIQPLPFNLNNHSLVSCSPVA